MGMLAKFRPKSHARKTKILQADQADFTCPVVSEKIFPFPRRANHLYKLAPSRPGKRGVAQRHERGLGCGGRGDVARRATSMRTAKSCGPDAPTLASSWRKSFHWRWWQKSPVTKESAKQAVTPSRGESRVVSGFTCGPTPGAFCCTGPMGAIGTRLSPRPLLQVGEL